MYTNQRIDHGECDKEHHSTAEDISLPAADAGLVQILLVNGDVAGSEVTVVLPVDPSFQHRLLPHW